MVELQPSPLSWPVESLRGRLAALRPGLRVEVVAECDSSNTRLLERARAGDLAPCLLVAERQTAGRGRLGRRWWSDGGSVGSLCFSLGLTLEPRRWEGLSLAVGVALAEALHPSLRLKWPNDLWLCADGVDRKLGGVLIETQSLGAGAARQVVVGVGINIRTPPAEAAAARGPIAAIEPVGLEQVDPALDAAAVLELVALPLLQALDRFEREGFDAGLQRRYAARDALLGRELQTLAADGSLLHRGRGAGIDDSGALLLDAGTSAPPLRLLSAEVTVRPLA
ncbi:biotin--[acetyl-CoA-carboxylase] ligase [Rivibacter subsaxonicus]|uniref:BirA family biotin operon repressor/biotin-[acetyl-CoA-carboxylase] ligase n=1 Tax=Rivibacter subsaxonicus TaxID=457575 RepID=A0A4Q7VWB3_9BURK|nr:biotin--[acetyl-CoA-carboxylase] ligase [Rivibacter subsaxonicus]RZU00609.1 BirA family biotin operon repressor/biotin-[acetyl-CoA-carboxylase] ligase [Rivibacter subsaxonicus]